MYPITKFTDSTKSDFRLFQSSERIIEAITKTSEAEKKSKCKRMYEPVFISKK